MVNFLAKEELDISSLETQKHRELRKEFVKSALENKLYALHELYTFVVKNEC